MYRTFVNNGAGIEVVGVSNDRDTSSNDSNDKDSVRTAFRVGVNVVQFRDGVPCVAFFDLVGFFPTNRYRPRPNVHVFRVRGLGGQVMRAGQASAQTFAYSVTGVLFNVR